ncbi:MAG: hypothetical protein HRT90_08025 [Candidatus Margulisbacteria bacterium]|nr:hypothetical protein [Candidatus Margulisiibacteriota bacterium]
MKRVIFYCQYRPKMDLMSQHVTIDGILEIWLHIDLYSIFETIKKFPIDYMIFMSEVTLMDREDVHDTIRLLSERNHEKQPEIIKSI